MIFCAQVLPLGLKMVHSSPGLRYTALGLVEGVPEGVLEGCPMRVFEGATALVLARVPKLLWL